MPSRPKPDAPGRAPEKAGAARPGPATSDSTSTLALRVDLRSTVWVTVAVLVAGAVAALFRNAGTAITQVAMGVILGLALDPLVMATSRRFGRSRTQSVAIVSALFLLVGVLVVVFVGPPAAKQAAQFGRQLPETLKEFENLRGVGGLLRRVQLKKNVNEWIAELPDKFNAASVQEAAARLLQNVVSFVLVACVVIATLLDGPRLLRLIRSLFRSHPAQLARLDRVGQVLTVTLGQYFGGSLTVASLMGLVVLVIGLALRIPLAPLAALWAALTDLIPQVGGLLGGGFLVILALTKGPVTALIAGGIFVIYMNIENHVISPAIVGESVDLTPAVTMLAAFVGGAIAGLPGSLVATPIVGAAKRLYLEFSTGRPAKQKPRTTGRARLQALVRKLRRA